jgi:hypothetical protein
LSNIDHVSHLDTASHLIKYHKRAGNVFINLTGDRGLSLYSATPNRLKGKFIEVFKRKPKTILGLTKVHLILHGAKVLKKYHLVALIVPFMAAVLGLNLLPVCVEWGVFAVSSGYALFLVLRRFKRRKSQRERRSTDAKPNNLNRQSGTRPRSVLQQ